MLTADKIRYENGVKISEKIIPDSARATKYVASWVPKGGKMKPCTKMDPIGVTIHNTVDLVKVNDDAEQYTRATWPNCNMAGAAVHYFVDDTGAWQNLREDEPGWHASDGQGNGNKRTIAIECIMDGTGSKEDLGARDNTARLIASILYRHKWTLSNLYTHNHWMGLPDKIVYGAKKNCPYYLLPKYSEFKALVQKYLDELKSSNGVSSSTQSTNNTPTSNPYKSIDIGDKVTINRGAIYGGLSTVRGQSVPTKCIGQTFTVSKLSYHKGVAEALLKEINSWIAVESLTEVGLIKVGSSVKIRSGAVYGGLNSLRGNKVPCWVVGKKLTVTKIQTNKGVKEALLKEITSWVAIDSLYSI